MDKIRLSELLEKYVDGNCTPDEIAVINQWYDKYADNPDYLNTLTSNQREFLKDKMLAGILKRANIDTVIGHKIEDVKVVSLQSRWWFSVSVAALIIIVAKFIIFDGWLNRQQQPAEVASIRLINNTRSITKQILPDSSVVWLRPKASLTFPKAFKGLSRNVVMQGDCFFEITKDAKRPFIMSSKHLITKVWGTSFQVSDHDDARQATVTVLTGKVSVSKNRNQSKKISAALAANEVMLKPAQKATYQQDKDAITTDARTNMATLNLWKHVNLSFDNQKLSSIIKVLNNKFNVKIQVADATLNGAAMTADLTDLNLPEILEVLKTSMKINYEITDDLITLMRAN